MIDSISRLQNKWNKEKEHYKSQEVGSGVQKFVKDVLKSAEIFNLMEGKLSTPLHKRKSEFLEEYKTEGRRMADVVIFVSPEIVIPIEVDPPPVNVPLADGGFQASGAGLDKHITMELSAVVFRL